MKIKDEIIKEIARRSYADYVEYVHEGRWIPSKHLLFICESIEKVLSGEIKRLIISLPPQHGKSQTITETLPSYYLGKNPTKRVIEASYGDDLARRFGRRNKQKIEQFGYDLFNIQLSKTSSSDTEFEIEGFKGSMISRGIMSGITGQPADLIIIDDPIKNKLEANSQTYRDRLWEEWLNSLNTRLSANGAVILIQTRWHEDDLAGRLLTYEKDKWTYINIPCEAEEDDILGREIGQALFPEIGKDDEWLKEFKKSYTSQEGSMTWNALFQGRPTAQEGNLIKRSWFRYYTEMPNVAHKVLSVDATFKDGDNNDFVAIQVWGKVNEDYYLIDRIKEHMDFPTTLQAVKNIQAKHHCNSILIEDKANGSAIISMLQKQMAGVIPINPEGGKVARVNAISPIIESGHVYIPEWEWTNDFINECVSFPNAIHDDEVDSMSQALNRLKTVNATIYIPTEHELMAQRRYEETVESIAGSGYEDILHYGG
jgi:predicted phage terminase large subunit-like protein